MLLWVSSRLWKLKRLPVKRRKVQQFKCVKGKATCNDVLLSLRGKEINNIKIDRNIKRFDSFSWGVVFNTPCLFWFCNTKHTGLWMSFYTLNLLSFLSHCLLVASVWNLWVSHLSALLESPKHPTSKNSRTYLHLEYSVLHRSSVFLLNRFSYFLLFTRRFC